MREKLTYLAQKKNTHKEELHKLLSIPFDIHNKEQCNQLSHYLDIYEFNLNQMYLYQGLSAGIKAWCTSYVIGVFLPIPTVIHQTLTTFFYIGLIASVLEQFNYSHFLKQHEEMKELYNWCLKDQKTSYNATIDNTHKLANPIIQRFIPLLAPLCEPNFMIVWPGNALKNNRKKINLYHIFFSQQKSNEQHFIEELKTAVEKKKFDKNTVEGLKYALKYFTSNEGITELQKMSLDMIPNFIKDTAVQVIQYNSMTKH